MPQNWTALSRYAVTCPNCGTRFLVGRFGWEGLYFRCPTCGELLENSFGPKSYLIAVVSVLVTGLGGYFTGWRGIELVLVTLGGSFLVVFLLTSILFHISPPKAEQHLKYGDTGLRLKDKKPEQNRVD
jgi:ribosomal protein S27E